MVWPATFSLAKAYLDQLERNKGLGADRISAVRSELANAEKQSGNRRRDALTQLTGQLDRDAQNAGDRRKVQMLSDVLKQLAGTTA